MKAIDAIKLAMQNIMRTKFRSFLTVLGVVIGVSAIVAFVSLGVGLQKITADQITNMNALTTLTVAQVPATSTMEEGPSINSKALDKLKKINNVVAVAESINVPANTVVSGTSAGAIVYGINPSNFDIEIPALSMGEKIANEGGAIISSALASAFSTDHNRLLGENLALKIIKDTGDETDFTPQELKFKVVGIDDNDTANMVYVPLENLAKVTGTDKYSSVKVKVKSRKNIDSAKEEIEKLGFQVTTIKDLIDQIDKVFLLIQIILGLVGGIGLLVSSLGIINTMTISLLERTHEIGIMKAVGATNKDIRRLYLTESALIGFFGGGIGILIAIGFGEGVNFIVNFLIRGSGQRLDIFVTPVNFSLIMVVLAILISIFSGLYPTHRAQKLSPIDALRQ